jgi:Phage major capsid protein E
MPTATEIPAEELYRSSTILEAIIQLPPAPVFLRDKLFGRVQISESDLVAVTYMKGSQKLSPFCSRYSKGTAIPRGKEQLRVFSPPFIKPNRMLSADDTFRVAGQLAGGKGSALATDRDAAMLAIDTQELDALISRREEKMCSDVLFTGKVVCLDGDTNEITAEISYEPISKSVTAKPWSDPTSNPLDDLKNAQRLVGGASGFNANFICMGRLAGDSFETNPNVLASYDKQHITPGVLNPKALEDIDSYGITVLGTWRGLATLRERDSIRGH